MTATLPTNTAFPGERNTERTMESDANVTQKLLCYAFVIVFEVFIVVEIYKTKYIVIHISSSNFSQEYGSEILCVCVCVHVHPCVRCVERDIVVPDLFSVMDWFMLWHFVILATIHYIPAMVIT